MEFDDQGTAEGVATSAEGDVFVANAAIGNGEIWRAPKGDFDEASMFAHIPGAVLLVGMDSDPVGNLYVAVAAFQDPNLHGLWKVGPDGTATRVAALPLASLPNDVTIDPRGNVYVSDSYNGRIFRLSPEGELSEWIQDDLLTAFSDDSEFGVNGIVYHNSTLYAAITVNGRVTEIPISADGSAGRPTILVEDEKLIGIDGIEPDARGNLYVANNLTSTIQVIHARSLEIETITGEGLSAPASLAFDKTQALLYVANLSTSAAYPRPYAPALVQAIFSVPVVTCTRFGDGG